MKNDLITYISRMEDSRSIHAIESKLNQQIESLDSYELFCETRHAVRHILDGTTSPYSSVRLDTNGIDVRGLAFFLFEKMGFTFDSPYKTYRVRPPFAALLRDAEKCNLIKLTKVAA